MRVLFILCIVLIGTSSLAQTRVILVRHAEKTTAKEDPGLTEAGQKRAEALMHTLDQFEVDALYSTPYKRTQLTLAPLAEDRNLKVAGYPPFSPEVFKKILAEHEDETIVFSGHSNTIPRLANLILGEDRFADYPEWRYDDMLILLISDNGVDVLPLKYGAVSTESK